MNVLQKLFGGGSTGSEKRYYAFTVKCLRCGETIEGRVDLNNDLSVEFEPGGDVYYSRKVLIGGGRCFQRVETSFQFNSERTLIEKQISGGEFV